MMLKRQIVEHIGSQIENFQIHRKQQLRFWQEADRVVVFGAGLMGEKVCSYLEQMGVETAVVCDNDPDQWGKQLMTQQRKEIKILPPSQVFQNTDGTACIIATGTQFFSQIQKQLEDYGVKNVFCTKYPDFYMEAMTVFLHMEQSELLSSTERLLELFDDEESLKILWCHFKEIFDMENKDDEWKEISFENLLTLPQYFWGNAAYLGRQNVMADCGAYTGDTLTALVGEAGYDSFKEYLCFELDAQNYKLLRKTVENMDEQTAGRIRTFNDGVGKNSRQVFYNSKKGNTTERNSGTMKGTIVALDERIADKDVTFIKMDIEGSEQDALYGAQNIIRNQKPVCAICIYHSIRDLFQIPFLLKKMVPEYQLLLKHHSTEWCDTVCYARCGTWNV